MTFHKNDKIEKQNETRKCWCFFKFQLPQNLNYFVSIMQIKIRVPLIIKITFYQQETENSLPLWMSKAKHEVFSINSNSMSIKKTQWTASTVKRSRPIYAKYVHVSHKMTDKGMILFCYLINPFFLIGFQFMSDEKSLPPSYLGKKSNHLWHAKSGSIFIFKEESTSCLWIIRMRVKAGFKNKCE